MIQLSHESRQPVSRRGFLQMVGGVVMSSLTGCAMWKPKCELAQNLPLPDLVQHLNANTDQITCWRCDDVGISASGASFLTPRLNATMAVERPRNFRLQAKAMSTDMVDLGSNDERFWFWIKEENGILTARHDQMAEAQRQLPLPFEPDWLIEALGVMPMDENEVEMERHPTEPKRVLLKRQRKAPDGSAVQLVSTVDSCLGVITQHTLVNKRGDIIALAKMGEHIRNGTKNADGKSGPSGPSLAHTVVLSWPKAQLGLQLRMGAIEINPKELPQRLFAMPDLKCPIHDIGGDGLETEQVAHEAPEPRSKRQGRARL